MSKILLNDKLSGFPCRSLDCRWAALPDYGQVPAAYNETGKSMRHEREIAVMAALQVAFLTRVTHEHERHGLHWVENA